MKNTEVARPEFKYRDDYKKSNWLTRLYYGWATGLVMHIYKKKSLDSVHECIEQGPDESSDVL